MRQPDVNIGVCNQLQTTLFHMKLILYEIQDFLRVRCAAQHSISRIERVDLAPSFQSRITTGAVINLAHIDISFILERSISPYIVYN